MKSILIPAHVTTIDTSAFSDCTALTSVEIPASVETIEAAAFRNCSSLLSVTFEKGSLLKTIGGQGLLNYDTESYGAFSYCTALTFIEIPASVETIEASAFGGCSSLSSIIFEDGALLKTIGGNAFRACKKLIAIEIPANVEIIEDAAFRGCSFLSIVTFKKGSHLKAIGGGKTIDGAFSYCTALTSIEIPASVETIEKAAFRGCSSLSTVTFEKGSHLKTIGGRSGHSLGNGFAFYDGAFWKCTALTSIEIPASVETIEATAFKDCSSLVSVTFEKDSQLKSIGGGYKRSETSSFHYGAFSDCTALTAIEIPANVETIETSAFWGCSSLATVTFEKGSQLKTISRAFSSCPIISIEIPASVETIEASAFGGCSKLATVTFEKGSQLKTIGGGGSYTYYEGAFCQLFNLMRVDMSECTQVEEIGEYAFYNDSKLQLFKIGTEIPPTCKNNYVFYGINPYSVLKVPSGCADAYKAATGWKNFASITGLDE